MARTHSTGHRISLTHLSAFSRIRHMPHSLLRWQMSSPLHHFPPISRCFHDVLDEVLGTHSPQQRDKGRLCVDRRRSGRVRRGAGFGVGLLPCLSSYFVHYGKKVSRYFLLDIWVFELTVTDENFRGCMQCMVSVSGLFALLYLIITTLYEYRGLYIHAISDLTTLRIPQDLSSMTLEYTFCRTATSMVSQLCISYSLACY
jgi:hypothetical protein